jgi:hypothetical protein
LALLLSQNKGVRQKAHTLTGCIEVLVLAAAFDEDIEEDVGSCTSSAMAQ